MSAADDFDSPYFIADGHRLILAWERDVVRIVQVECPNSGTVSLCNRRRSYCVVRRFIEVYGTECNVGKTVLDGPVEVAWMPVNGNSDLDHEFAQVWIVPVDDPDYRAMQGDAQT